MPESQAQKQIIARVMHEAKHGELTTAGGRKVRNPKQAIAIALHEAGASKFEDRAMNQRDLARTKAKERQARPRATRPRAPPARPGRRSTPRRNGAASRGARA